MKPPWRSKEVNAWPTNAELAEKYCLPFSWGALHVSEQADHAYGLLPLATDHPQEPRLQPGRSLHFRADVWLLGPSEIDSSIEAAHYPQTGDISLFTSPILSPDGIDLVCRFDKSDQELIERLQQKLDCGEAELEEDAPPDVLAQIIHQNMAHALSDSLNSISPAVIGSSLEGQINSIVMSGVKRSLLNGLGPGVLVPAVDLAIEGGVNPFIESVSGGYIIMGGLLAYQAIKKYFRHAAEIRLGTEGLSQLFGSEIAEDIHRTYCASHFNDEMRQNLGNMPEDFN